MQAASVISMFVISDIHIKDPDLISEFSRRSMLVTS